LLISAMRPSYCGFKESGANGGGLWRRGADPAQDAARIVDLGEGRRRPPDWPGRDARRDVAKEHDDVAPACAQVGESIRKRLGEGSGEKIEIFTDFLDLIRLPDDAYGARMASFFADKYERTPST
jgi:hypothetical protein